MHITVCLYKKIVLFSKRYTNTQKLISDVRRIKNSKAEIVGKIRIFQGSNQSKIKNSEAGILKLFLLKKIGVFFFSLKTYNDYVMSVHL